LIFKSVVWCSELYCMISSSKKSRLEERKERFKTKKSKIIEQIKPIVWKKISKENESIRIWRLIEKALYEENLSINSSKYQIYWSRLTWRRILLKDGLNTKHIMPIALEIMSLFKVKRLIQQKKFSMKNSKSKKTVFASLRTNCGDKEHGLKAKNN
jgi:hypothetical protein